MTRTDDYWMAVAIESARDAENRGEVPVGAVVVSAEGEQLAASGNMTITNNDPTAHAEIIALREAAIKIGNYRLVGAIIYSTVEPSAMSAGALVNARVARLIYGVRDKRFGAVETLFRLCDDQRLNHRIEIVSGVRSDECRQLMQDFFRSRRN